ncbi:uncharacterized protein LOC107782683 [Nicotiana tabacum]|uniref:Uncharacterized protein LOC107782683 n=2 Tax=Nicotiana TaxID=4085 RepID=A0A1S3Z3U2_TOBAC|nr:PREDICTED: uncharacterized protein LOC104240215 [Nicotiana sylvestris]XP_016459094.1 PREDICTED: uncharacterized protein LOC107782683 [Nicotiana tabacum]
MDINPKQVFHQIWEFLFFTEKNPIQNSSVRIKIHWERPPPNKIKLNIDGAFLKDKFHAGIRGVFRNSSGNWIMGFTKSCYTYSSMHAELLALEEGLKLPMEMPFVDTEIESD